MDTESGPCELPQMFLFHTARIEELDESRERIGRDKLLAAMSLSP
jgi:hypothetical protein